MDPFQLIAMILWVGLAVALIALIAGLASAQGGYRNRALALLFAGVVGTLGFSFIGGFSIGRFTAMIPVLFIGYMIAMGRGSMAVGLSLVGGAFLYLLFSWLLTPLVETGGVLALPFAFWAIPVYAMAAVGAFGWALKNPPRGGRSGSG